MDAILEGSLLGCHLKAANWRSYLAVIEARFSLMKSELIMKWRRTNKKQLLLAILSVWERIDLPL